MILLIRDRATPHQIEQMFECHKFYVKMAVDVERSILAGGGQLHADCEAILLEDGSRQTDIWGASWMPSTQKMIYESMVNLRPRQNRSMEILDPSIRQRIAQITQQLIG
ncbi:MAG: hypothetical protein H0X31_08385 [Nostocaceae cyanobacterium]|nr:hypothetical protein [Nostocaceae cyanobacterium]